MEYVKPFLLGGSLIAGSKLISKYVSPEFAPLIGGLPTGIIASFFLTGYNNKKLYFEGYLISSIIITLSVIFINLFASKFPKLSFDKISLFSLLCWAIISYFAINYEKKKF